MNRIWLPISLGGQVGKLEYSMYGPLGEYGAFASIRDHQMNKNDSLLVWLCIVALLAIVLILVFVIIGESWLY